MARITVEDCLEQIPNRFQLVLAATPPDARAGQACNGIHHVASSIRCVRSAAPQ